MESKPGLRWGLMLLLSLCAGGLAVGLGGWRADANSSRSQTRSQPGSPSHPEALEIFAGGIVEGTGAPLALRFETAGRLKQVLVKEGELVAAGQVLAELDSDVAELRLKQAEADYRIAQIEQSRLTSGIRQRTTLVKESVAPTSNEAAIASARAAKALAVVQELQLQVRMTRLTAPIDGTILSAPLTVGELISPDSTTAPIVMINRDHTRVRAFVEELDALDVQPGQNAKVIASGRSEQIYPGTIVSCALDVRPKSHRHLNPGERLDVRVREILVELDDGADLLIGLPVEVLIQPRANSETTPDTESSPTLLRRPASSRRPRTTPSTASRLLPQQDMAPE